LGVWLMFEMNSIVFCILAVIEGGKNRFYCKDSIVKYFFIQSFCSAIFLMRVMRDQLGRGFFHVVFVFSIIVKLASSPFHFWFIKMIDKLGFFPSLMIMTWQKSGPFFILSQFFHFLVILFVLSTSLIPSILQFFSNGVIKVLGFSSVFNNGWIMLCGVFRTAVIIFFMVVY
jgi:hypothetical protein